MTYSPLLMDTLHGSPLPASVHQDLQAILDLQDQLELLARRVEMEQLEQQAIKGHAELQVLRARRAHWARQATQARLEPLAQRAERALQVLVAHRARQARQGQPARRERPEIMAQQEQQARQARREVLQAQPVHILGTALRT